KARRRKSLGSAWRTGEAGCSSTTVNAQAETMKRASSEASIRYSGQWLRSASHMTATRLNFSELIDVVSDASGSAISRHRIRPQLESDSQSEPERGQVDFRWELETLSLFDPSRISRTRA